MSATPHALIVSPHPGWAAQTGLAGMLSSLGLSVRETSRLALASAVPGEYAVIIVRLAAGGAAPDFFRRNRAELSGAIVFTYGAVPAQQFFAGEHLRAMGRCVTCPKYSCGILLPDPIREASLATALASAGYALPLPDGHAAIGTHLSQLVDGDATVTAELIVSLLDASQTDLRHFREACASHCWSEARASAHRIKSTAHFTGATALVALSQRIEALAEQGRGDTVQALAALYLPAVEKLSQALAALAG